MLLFHAPVQHAPVLEFGKTEVLRHCVALQFASIWEHLNELRLWSFSKIRRWRGGGDRHETDPAPALTCTHGRDHWADHASCKSQIFIDENGDLTRQILIFVDENGDITSANLTISLMKMAISRVLMKWRSHECKSREQISNFR